MPVGDPVGNDLPVPVRLHALHDALHPPAQHVSRRHAVPVVGGAYPVRLNEPYPEVVRLSRPRLQRQGDKGVPVHQEAEKGQLLEAVKVIYPVRIAGRGIRPQGELPENMCLQFLHLPAAHAQEVPVYLRGGHEPPGDHVRPQGLQGGCGRRNAHICVPASLPQQV